MATKTIITDDINGDFGAKTRTFSLGGVKYTLDLTDENYDRLLVQPLQDLISVATVGAPPARRYSTYAERNQAIFARHTKDRIPYQTLAQDFGLSYPRIVQIMEDARVGRFGASYPMP